MRNLARKARRKRRLSESDKMYIVKLINDFSSERLLTWYELEDLVQRALGYRWTRQALQAHETIRAAYLQQVEQYKRFRREGKVPPTKQPEVVILQQKLDRERSENAALNETLHQYDELLFTYFVNAIKHGLSVEKLEAPLVPPYSGWTDEEGAKRVSMKVTSATAGKAKGKISDAFKAKLASRNKRGGRG